MLLDCVLAVICPPLNLAQLECLERGDLSSFRGKKGK